MAIITPPPSGSSPSRHVTHEEAFFLPAESESTRLERFIREEFERSGEDLPDGSISIAVQQYYTWCLKNGKEP